MSHIKKFITLNIVLMLCSCGTIKEGFTNQKKNSSDEFLVEKKLPLVMPPDYDELPIPKDQNVNDEKNESKIKSIILKNKNKLAQDINNAKDGSLEDALLKKIKDN